MFGLHDNEAILPSDTGGSQVDQQLTEKGKELWNTLAGMSPICPLTGNRSRCLMEMSLKLNPSCGPAGEQS